MGEKCGALVFPALQMWISHDHPQTNMGCFGYRNILLIPTNMHSFPQNCSFPDEEGNGGNDLSIMTE